MKRVKHIILWVAVVSATAPFSLPVLLNVQRMLIQQEMTERLEREELITLSLEPSTINWEKPGKEIWIGGALFDIKQSRSENGKLIVDGLFDHKEKAIVSKMNGAFAPIPFEKERQQSIYYLLHLEALPACISTHNLPFLPSNWINKDVTPATDCPSALPDPPPEV